MTGSLRRPAVAPIAADAAAVLGPAVPLFGFRLAGGTALAWHLGHRVSEDLDFFTFEPDALSASEPLAPAIEKIADAGSLRVAERTMHASVRGCRVSFFAVEGTWFDPPHRVSEGFDLASVREIAAMKLVAVMTRCAKKDFHDLVAIAHGGVSLAEMVSCGRRMYAGFDEALPHLRRALLYFDEAEDDPDPESLIPRTWSEVKREMVRLAREI